MYVFSMEISLKLSLLKISDKGSQKSELKFGSKSQFGFQLW